MAVHGVPRPRLRTRARLRTVTAAGPLGVTIMLPGVTHAQDSDGFNGYVQSGTCDSPTDDVRVSLDGRGEHDVRPYEATSPSGKAVVLGYYGAPELPGFGLAAVYTDEDFSLVTTDGTSGETVACGDLLEADYDSFRQAGTAAVQLTPVGDAKVQGVAMVQRAALERELDVTPTAIRILLTDEATTPTGEMASGYEGFVQGGTCKKPDDNGVRVELETSDSGTDVRPYSALSGSGERVTPAYYGAALAPGFGLAAAYTDVDFSVVITDAAGGAAVACGDLLEPASDDFTKAGLALVELRPVGDNGVQGFAMAKRLGMQRELDVTPARVQVLLFAPPVGG